MKKTQFFILIFSVILNNLSEAQNIPAMMGALENKILSTRPAPLRDIETRYEISVRNYGAIPNDNTDDYSAIQNAINDAKLMSGAVKVIFEKGKYLVSPPNSSAAINVSGINNLVIEGNDAEIIVKRQRAGFSYVSNSENVIIRNFSIDYDPLPFSEGVIQSVAVESGYFTVKIDPGYPLLTDAIYKDFTSYGAAKDPNYPGKLKDNTPNFLSVSNVIEIGDRLYMIFLTRPQEATTLKANDRYTHVFRPGEVASTGRVRNSTNVTFQNLKIYASPSLVFGSFLSSNLSILKCSMIVKSGRYTVANADGLHVSANRFGPWVEDSEFTGLTDDAVNIYTTPAFAKTKVSANQLEMTSVAGININDVLSFWKPSTGKILAELKVTNIVGNIVTFDQNVPALNLPPVGEVYDRQLWAQKYDHAFNISNIGSYFVFRNNYFHDSRRFGIYIKSSFGLIENNRILRMSNSGIRVNNEPSWPEGFYSESLVIKNNTIENCMTESILSATDNAQINVAFHGGTSKNQKNIFIHNNTIKTLKTPAIRFANAHDVFITNNDVSGTYSGNLLQLSNTCNVITSANSGISDSRITCSDMPFYTSVKTTEMTNEAQLFPNPASTFLKLTRQTDNFERMEIVSQNGQILKVFNPSPDNRYSIEHINPGVYLARMFYTDDLLVTKLIIQ